MQKPDPSTNQRRASGLPEGHPPPEPPSLAEKETLDLLAYGGISMADAARELGLSDAGRVIALMRERGVRPYRRASSMTRDPASLDALESLILMPAMGDAPPPPS